MAIGVGFTVTVTELLVTEGVHVPLTTQVILAPFSVTAGFVIVKVEVVKLL